MLYGVPDRDEPYENEGHSTFFFFLSWRRAIFPQGPPCSIVAAVEFHHQVRDGSVWFLYAWDTRISTL